MGCVSLPSADQLGGSEGLLIVEAFISFIIIVIGKRGRGLFFWRGFGRILVDGGIIDQTFDFPWN